jgi:hypothetical protein
LLSLQAAVQSVVMVKFLGIGLPLRRPVGT